MKISKILITSLLFSLLFFPLLAGCNFPSPALSPAATLPSQTKKPSTATFTLTHTFVPTSNETQTPTTSGTPTSTITLTPQPTLSDAERKTTIEELLKINGGCKLPCWWGINPGQSTWDEAKLVFSHLGIETDYTKRISYSDTLHAPKSIQFWGDFFYIQISLIETKGLISSMSIEGDGINDQTDFKELLQAYSPENILSIYGIPSRVWIRSFAGFHETSEESSMGYQFLFFYDRLGFLIIYAGDVAYKPIYHMCPTFERSDQLYGLEIYTLDPKGQMKLDELPELPSTSLSGALPIEKVAGISVSNFYDLYKNATGPVCFDTPKDIWK